MRSGKVWLGKESFGGIRWGLVMIFTSMRTIWSCTERKCGLGCGGVRYGTVGQGFFYIHANNQIWFYRVRFGRVGFSRVGRDMVIFF